MGQPRYRGPVETVEQAVWAGRVLSITCQNCRRTVSKWAWTLCNEHAGARAFPLRAAIPGFWCSGCRRRVSVVMTSRVSGELG